MSKDILLQLSLYTADRLDIILKDSKKCLDFLKFLSNTYKYELFNAVSIYAQMPTATAVADFDFWDKKAGLSIIPGSVGIRIFSEETKTGTYARMFDISQTFGDKSKINKMMWHYNSDHAVVLSNVFCTNHVINDSDGLYHAYVDIMQQESFPAVAAAIITAHRLKMPITPKTIEVFHHTFSCIDIAEKENYLEKAQYITKEYLEEIERGVRHGIYSNNEQSGVYGEEQHDSDKRERILLSTDTGGNKIYPHIATERDTNLRHRGNAGYRPRNGNDEQGISTTGIQQTVLSGFEADISEEVSRADKNGRVSEITKQNRPGLLGSLFKTPTRVGKRDESNQSTRLSSKSTIESGNKKSGKRNNITNYVGAISPVSTIEKKEPSHDGSFFIGDTVVFNGRNYQIVDINTELNRIDLMDLDFQNAKGTPLIRSTLLSMFEQQTGLKPDEKYIKADIEQSPTLAELISGDALENNTAENEESAPSEDEPTDRIQENNSLTLADLLKKTEDELKAVVVEDSDIAKQDQPVIPQPINYVLSRAFNEKGGAKTKFKSNIEAIRLVKQLQQENRQATYAEQETLSKYTGWGGLSQAFDENNQNWEREYSLLKEILDDDEYNSAKSSVLTAFYTNQDVVTAMYKAFCSFGLVKGNILDPACGTGNFFGYCPEGLEYRFYGVEIDTVSGNIAKYLYPNATVQLSGYENTQFSNLFFQGAIGNIPFGDIKVFDQQYNKWNFNIHDYFFAKTIDKVAPGGIIAFITSKGVMDKKNSTARQYIFERCDLIGAIRLPNNTFKEANTEVTSDIVFLQKRPELRLDDIPFLNVVSLGDGIEVNEYFAENPHMMLGVMTKESNMYGSENMTTLSPFPASEPLGVLLDKAIKHLHVEILAQDSQEEDENENIPAVDGVRNYTYAVVNDLVYYREQAFMFPVKLSSVQTDKLKKYCLLRDTLKELLELQTKDVPDEALIALRNQLNIYYDEFIKKYGHLNERKNEMVFSQDLDVNLVLALENSKDNSKTNIFYERTVRPRPPITYVDNAMDALALSITNRGKVDINYMTTVYPVEGERIINELEQANAIYINPSKLNDPLNMYETADEYLSGDLQIKLSVAKINAETDERFKKNVLAIEKAFPEKVTAADIHVKLGATWIDVGYYRQFMYELLRTPTWKQAPNNNAIDIVYDKRTSEYRISNKSQDDSANVVNVFGTSRVNAYQIIERTLNLQDVIIKDATPYITRNGNDSVKYIVNKKETAIARQKQELIRTKFQEWIFHDTERRRELETKYNSLFNSIRPRIFDSTQLGELPGLTQEITLTEYQKRSVVRMRNGGNILLDHPVGAGKTFSMIIGAYEQIRLGKANRAMFVIPNHLIGQFTKEIYRLYSDVNVLAVTQADFAKSKRQQFLSRIAMGDASMIVIGHSQFEKIQMSYEYQKKQIDLELSEIIQAMTAIKEEKGERYSIKQLEKQKANLESRLQKIYDDSKKDKMITFDKLGVDCIIVDEAHYFKNCAIFSKMRNVAGINTAMALKASDMLMKINYVIEKGGIITFATATPLSNSMCELYVMQRYLQNNILQLKGIHHFDEWASNFGETTTSLELTPEGNGYRLKTRFSKFYNLPELMKMFAMVADIVLPSELSLPIPKLTGGRPIVVSCQPNDDLNLFMADGIKRVEHIRDRKVEPWEDNMLKFISDFRKAGLDMRLIDPNNSFDETGKLALCAKNIYEEYRNSTEIKGTQLVFCDTSTYNPSAPFDVYREEKRLLVGLGIPESEIAFIHDAKNEHQKQELFEKVRAGEIRILLGSTQKCGVGTNVQDKLIALHHLDCPYRPSDIEQREGRILRQGNTNDEVRIYRYVTEKSFDAYLWNIVINKQKFISQFMQGTYAGRSCEDIDDVSLSFAEAQAIASGNPKIRQKIELDAEVQRLSILKNQYIKERYTMQDKVDISLPREINGLIKSIEEIKKDIPLAKYINSVDFLIKIGEVVYDNREKAGEALLNYIITAEAQSKRVVGQFGQFYIEIEKPYTFADVNIYIKGEHEYLVKANPQTTIGNITRIENAIKSIESQLEQTKHTLIEKQQSLQSLQEALAQPFAHDKELIEKTVQLAAINAELDVGGQDTVEGIDDENDAISNENDLEIESAF